MNATTKQVIDDMRDTMWHEARPAVLVPMASVPQISRQMCLGFAWPGISTRFTQPLRPDLLLRLQVEISQHPEMLKAVDYPLNIVKWIEDHLFDWDSGDLLGVYLPRVKAVELYWLSIVLCARRNNWAVSDLAQVVLVHELAHACTHLGKDAEGRNWDTDSFCRQSPGVMEGLAQYWTHYVIGGLKTRTEAFLPVFLGLMKGQPAPYRSHMTWLEEKAQELYQDHGVDPVRDLETTTPFHRPICEHVRGLMITLREGKTTPTVKEFTNSLALAHVASEQACELF